MLPRMQYRAAISRYVTLVVAFAWADFKLRFHGSVLGITWSLIRPLFIFAVAFVVFALFIQVPVEHYAAVLLIGIILWNFFAEGTTFSIVSIDEKAALLKKIAFPRSVIVVSAILTAFYSLCFNLVVLLFLGLVTGIPFHGALLVLPLYIVPHMALTLGTGFFVAALFSKFRDVRPVWEMCMQLGAWLTPVVYSVSAIPEVYRSYVYINPIARVIEYAREAVLYGTMPQIQGVLVLYVVAGAIGLLGLGFFQRRSRYFAEEL